MIHHFECLGVGLGYRHELGEEIVKHRSEIDFLELLTESCFKPFLQPKYDELSKLFPFVCHGVEMSIGTAEPLDQPYLEKIYQALIRYKPSWFSDHLAITRVGSHHIGHLSPLASSEEAIEVISKKVKVLQEKTGLTFLLENIAYLFQIPGGEMKESEFISRVVTKADCGILLDLNNLYVNAKNHRYDPYAFLNEIPLERVIQIHMAGGAVTEGIYLDTHAHPIGSEAFDYLEYVCRRAPVKGILLERDDNMPPFPELVEELRHCRRLLRGGGGDSAPRRSQKDSH